MRRCPVFPAMTSSLMPEWDLKVVLSEGGISAQQVCCLAILRGGLVHSFLFGRPGQRAMTIRLCVFIFFFFFFFSLHTISSLQWRSHLFLPQATSWWMSRARLHRHSRHVWNIKCVNVKVLGTWISSAWCQRRSVMQSVMVGLCTQKHTARTAPSWQLMSQCFVSSAFCLMHVKRHSHTVPTAVCLFNTIFPPPCTAMQLVHWRFWKVWNVYSTHIPVFHLVVCSFFFL